MVAYGRDRNLRDILVHTSDKSQPGPLVGTSPCAHTRCRTCGQFPLTPPCKVLNVPSSSRKRSPAKQPTWCIASPVVVVFLSMSEKLAVHSGNALGSTYAAFRKTCPVFQSRSISMLTAILCTTQKSVALCSAQKTTRNAANFPTRYQS